jgi:hypothetical protein
LETDTAVRTVGFSASANTISVSTDQRMGKPCQIRFYDIRDSSQMRM